MQFIVIFNVDYRLKYLFNIRVFLGKPFYPITLRNTREVAGFNGLAEALIRLDFSRALRDVRRFNYVASLMQLLFSHDKLSQLPGIVIMINIYDIINQYINGNK